MTTATPIKAIETRYNGYRFRSRLEARWAVFFDALGVKYEYEKEGFELGDVRYLPDFWLPELGCWIEIKPLESDKPDTGKARSLSLGPSPVYVVRGLPSFSGGVDYLIQSFWHGREESIYECFVECFVCKRVSISWTNDLGTRFCSYYCEWCDVQDRCTDGERYEGTGCYFHKGSICTGGRDPRTTASLVTAYAAAKSARFEHGESGVPVALKERSRQEMRRLVAFLRAEASRAT